MNKPIEEIPLKDNHVLRIYQDEDAESPREWDNIGKMCCWHSRYDLGDKHNFESPDEMFCEIAGILPNDEAFDGEDLENTMALIRERASRKAIILPLGLYDHSGITMSVGRVSGWDYSNVGYIYVTEEEACKNWNKKSFDDLLDDWCGPNKGQKITVREAAERLLRSEVKTYDQYLTGEAYGFRVVKLVPKTWINKDDPTETVDEIDEKEIDSCWGFYGDDWMTNGIADHVNDELFTDEQKKEIKQANKELFTDESSK